MPNKNLPQFTALPLLALFVIGMAAIQFSTADMPDNDGFYHIKLAQVMRTDGLKPDFVWLPLSILNADEFYDHHFLFHVALMPFTFGDLRIGAKWAAVIFSSLAFLAIWFLFQRQKIPYAWLWALGLLGISDAFLYRMSVTRAQSLSLAALALACLWLIEGKHKHLAILSFVYVWLYDAFPLIVALGGLHFLAVALIERRFDFRPLLYISAGVFLGLIINPYFPQNLIFSYHHMLPKLTNATSVQVGNEWFPYDTKQILTNSFPSLIAFVSGILALGLSDKKMDTRTAFSLFAALLFGLMFLQARRFVEYFPPFALIFAAFACAPLLAPKADSVSANASPRRLLVPGLLGLLIVVSISRTLPRTQEMIGNSKSYDLYQNASAWLEANSAAGERVFQSDWDDFPRLFFYNSHNTYLIGLDPTYMQLYDPQMYALWVEITDGNVKDPSSLIADMFGARYVLSDLNHGDFLRSARTDAGLLEVYHDDQAVIFEVLAQP